MIRGPAFGLRRIVRFLKPVETAPGTLPDHAGDRDGQRLHPRPADPAALSGQHHPVRKPEQPLSGPFVAAGVLEADRDRGDVVPRPDVQPDPRDVGAPGRRWVSWTLRIGASSGEDCRISRHMVVKSPPDCHIR